MCPSIIISKTITVVNTTAPPAMTPNFAPDDMRARSPTPGITSETWGLTPPMNSVPQSGQAIASSGTRAEQPLHGQVGEGSSTTAVATGTAGKGAATTGAATTGGASTGAVTAVVSGANGSGTLGAGTGAAASAPNRAKHSVHQAASPGTAASHDGQRTVVTSAISAGRRGF